MIFIDFDENAFSEEVRIEASRLSRELLALADDPSARARFIEANADFWRQHIRPVLERLSARKCWYSEARDIVSSWHVDHFRPKGDVREDGGAGRPGYWWLAFKISNYRLAGPIMNSPRRVDMELLGKWDRFPLAEGSYIASDAACDENLETPILLDPCRQGDWTLLTFDESGKPIPNCDEGEFGFYRAEQSIKLLHLDFDPLNEERRRIWNDCQDLILAASTIMRLPQSQISFRNAELERIFVNIQRMIADDAELSSVARACLQHSPFKWAQKMASRSFPRRIAA